jgi:hypothetical protein
MTALRLRNKCRFGVDFGRIGSAFQSIKTESWEARLKPWLTTC